VRIGTLWSDRVPLARGHCPGGWDASSQVEGEPILVASLLESSGDGIRVSHRGAVYTVRVRTKRAKADELHLLGDIDGRGTSLGAVIGRYMPGFEAASADGSKVVRCVTDKADGDDLLLTFQHGQDGVAADIVGSDGGLRYHQTSEDSQLLRCACLFRLPSSERIGWLATHVNNGRGIKGLLDKGLNSKFRTEFGDRVLEITPFVLGSALEEAVRNGRVDKVKLVKLERPNDRANAATDKWVPSGAEGRLELSIAARGRAQRLITNLLSRFLTEQDRAAFGEIVEFQGMTFDEARVEVLMPNGVTRRTFNIEQPDAGHAFTEDLDDLEMANDGSPLEDSLFEALRTILGNVSG